MTTYKLCNSIRGGQYVERTDDNGVSWAIPFDEANTDYQEYLKWLDEGNTPHSADGTTNLTPLNREAE